MSTISTLVVLGIPVAYTLIELIQWWCGAQGVDFAMFTQAIQSGGATGRLETSLLGLRWTNLLTHHFSPIWYAPAALTWLGLSPPLAGIGCHALAIFGMIYFARRIALLSGWSCQGATCGCVLLMFHPSLRSGLSWEIREEILALPLLAAAIAFSLESRPRLALLTLTLTMLCKETFFVIAPLTFFAGFVDHYIRARISKEWILCAVAITTLGAVAASLYLVILPGTVFQSTFNPTTRVANLSELLTTDFLTSKALWLAAVLLPLFTAPLWCKSGWLFSLPALPAIAAILVSNLPAMADPTAYYSVQPVYLLGLASLIGIGRELPEMACGGIASWVMVGGLCITLILRPPATISYLDYLRVRRIAQAEVNSVVPIQYTVIADDFDTSLVWNHTQVIRMSEARKSRPHFNFILTQIAQVTPLAPWLLANSTECYRSPYWIIRCAKDPPTRLKLTL